MNCETAGAANSTCTYACVYVFLWPHTHIRETKQEMRHRFCLCQINWENKSYDSSLFGVCVCVRKKERDRGERAMSMLLQRSKTGAGGSSYTYEFSVSVCKLQLSKNSADVNSWLLYFELV